MSRVSRNREARFNEVKNIRIYEVVLYNIEVRSAVEFDERHPRYDSAWADPRYIELTGYNVKNIIRKIRSKYPRSRGFKIVAITEIDEYSSTAMNF
ncbi:MAG: hypothetical protein P8J14_06240 [Emcibacteraceae bacterium]|nr:hypothetical protein [Emcibacteraceae bacterium]